MGTGQGISPFVTRLRQFGGATWRRFSQDRCWRMAAGLSYTSLLAVVPLSAIAFAMLAAFPVFEGVRDRFQDALFSNFLPQSAEAMRTYFDQFIANTTTLSAVGIIGLAATAVLLLGTIEADLNVIFRVKRPRPLIPRLLVFWAMITLGPLLVGASFSLSTYLFVATQWLGLDLLGGPLGVLGRFAPTALIIAGLSAFYMVIPNRRVPLKPALAGGIIAGVLFSLLRYSFGWYVAAFPTYQNVYGALSVVPIFLIWMYLSWTVVLLGAVITISAGEWGRAARGAHSGTQNAAEHLYRAVAILAVLYAASKSGHGVTQSDITEQCEHGEDAVEGMLASLSAATFVHQTEEGLWHLSRDMGEARLFDLYNALKLGVWDTSASHHQADISDGWRKRLADCLRAANTHAEHDMGMPLRDILQDG